MSEENQAADEGGDDIGVVVLMLGLYLIVLAFFILLNAISESSPDKRDLVVESVREGFDFREEGPGVGSDPTEITAPPAYEAMVQSLDGMLQSYLEIDEFDVSGNQEKVKMDLDIYRFFHRGKLRIIPDMVLFFKDLAAIINSRSENIRATVQVMVSGDDSTLNGQTNMDSLTLAGRRSALFTRALIEEGVGASQISAGAYAGEPSLSLTFHLLTKDVQEASEQFNSILNSIDGSNFSTGGAR